MLSTYGAELDRRQALSEAQERAHKVFDMAHDQVLGGESLLGGGSGEWTAIGSLAGKVISSASSSRASRSRSELGSWVMRRGLA